MEIDYTKLSRDYKEHPITSKEPLVYEDVKYLYMQLNYTKEQTVKVFGCSTNKLQKFLSEFNMRKTPEMIQASQKQLIQMKYGVDNVMHLKENKKKLSKTLRSRTKEQIEETVKKTKETCRQKYGTDNVGQVEEFKQKKIQTSLENWGTENPQQSEIIRKKIQNTCLEKYGAECVLSPQSCIYETKIIKGIRDKYGVDNVMQNKEIARKTGDTQKARQEEYIERHRQLHGVDYPAQTQLSRKLNGEGVKKALPQIYETKKKHNTFVKSEAENTIYELLSDLFHTKRNYSKDPRYPFNCDFYIPSLDLFIEYQGNWTHGFMPYIEDDDKCKEQLCIWESKNESEYYRNAIENWTIRDVKKRNLAKENALNWLEFFNMEQFMEWYDELCEIYK